MVDQKRKVLWSKSARDFLIRHISFIKIDSPKNADKVKKEILASTRLLADLPERYMADKYKKGNDGRYRVYELHKLRISYLIVGEPILIVRIRHTSMLPKEY